MLRLFVGLHGFFKQFKLDENGAPVVHYTVFITFLTVMFVAYGFAVGEWLAASWMDLGEALGIVGS